MVAEKMWSLMVLLVWFRLGEMATVRMDFEKLACHRQTNEIDCHRLNVAVTAQAYDEGKRRALDELCYVLEATSRNCYAICHEVAIFSLHYSKCHNQCPTYEQRYCQRLMDSTSTLPQFPKLDWLSRVQQGFVRWSCSSSTDIDCRKSHDPKLCFVDPIRQTNRSCFHQCHHIDMQSLDEANCQDKCPGFLQASCRMSNETEQETEKPAASKPASEMVSPYQFFGHHSGSWILPVVIISAGAVVATISLACWCRRRQSSDERKKSKDRKDPADHDSLLHKPAAIAMIEYDNQVAGHSG